MESSPAFLCLWMCFIVYASTSNGCSEIPVVENAVVSESSKKTQYSEDDILEYNCDHGYISQRKITYKCTNNEWKIVRDVKCSLKPCESPQDIPNGHYVVEKGKPFVFGTTIKYICNDGYQIMSRFDTRTCREGGWDNQLPECEEVSCQRIVPEGNVRVAGLPDHSDDFIRSGHRLTFSCEGNGLIIRGEKVITCQSNGEWSSPLPKCVEATCLLQSNRTVGDLRIQRLPDFAGPVKPGHKLTFACTGEGMTLNGEKIITCLPNGEWSSPFPICQDIVCEGEQLLNVEILLGHPSIVSPYKPGHILVFRCTDENLKLNGHRAIECKSDGQWDHPYPTCRDRCEVPRDQHVNRPYNDFRGDLKLGVRKSYRCEPGYRQTAAEATCTQDGWTPKPLCAEITCELQSTICGEKKIIPERKTIFRAGESVEIVCSEKGWYGNTKETKKSFRCQENGDWDHKPVCGEIRCEVPRDKHVHDPHEYFKGELKLGARIPYSCFQDGQYKNLEATCTTDGWTPKPLCPDTRCEVPRDQHVNRPYDDFRGDLKQGERRSYRCESGYRQTAAEATCTQDGWTPDPLCAVITGTGKCGPPPGVDNGDTTDITKKEYNTGEQVEYVCFSKYTLEKRPPFSKYLTCVQGEWRGNIKCLKPCTVTVEIMNERGIELAFTGDQKMFAPHEDHITFRCLWGKRLVGGGFRKKCNDGVMTLPECV